MCEAEKRIAEDVADLGEIPLLIILNRLNDIFYLSLSVSNVSIWVANFSQTLRFGNNGNIDIRNFTM